MKKNNIQMKILFMMKMIISVRINKIRINSIAIKKLNKYKIQALITKKISIYLIISKSHKKQKLILKQLKLILKKKQRKNIKKNLIKIEFNMAYF